MKLLIIYFLKPYKDGCVSYEREEQREIQTHESDTTFSSGGTVNSKFNIAVRDRCVTWG
jgi:hypothetical protein